MLEKRKPLVAKTPLRANKTVLKQSKLKKAPKHPISRLKAKADVLFAFYIRLRDSEWQPDGSRTGECITCDRICVVINSEGKRQKSNGWGHFIGRGDWNLRFDEENVNLQCSHCNAWRDKESMLDAYKKALDFKYGDGTARKLKMMHKNRHLATLPRLELEQIIHDAQEYINFYLADHD